MVEFRRVPEARAREYEAILSHAFEIESGPASGDDVERSDGTSDSEDWPPDLYEPWGLFDGDTLVSVCKLYYLDAYLHDGFGTIGGLGGVATPPEHRRQGYVRQLLRSVLREYREADVDAVTLWPFSVPFYRNHGWGIANKYTTYELPPEQLAFESGREGTVRRLGADDWTRLRSVEVAFGTGTALSLRRSERWWRDRTLSAWSGRGEPYVYGYERNGELRGYVLYTVERNDEGDRTLRVTDLAHADDDAYRGLLGFLADHDSQVTTVQLPRAEETELLDRVRQPSEVDCTVSVGPMIRLADVQSALRDYPWPAGLDVQFTLGISDPLVERNDGAFAIDLAEDTASVRAIDAIDDGHADPSAVAGPADVEMDVSTLSRLYVGSVSLGDAERFGSCVIHRSEVEDPLGIAFPPRSVCLREFF
ncbi:Acetyltransferase (GNAT) family [Halalkaliarchaeum sp. AArc-CO]|uniref:GNAT family N-acetyltransferase n=1 Tax=unclassified Halalkaliarchaeum TaxID=2678344 RepID=UPI00217E8BC7|nr:MULTISPECIES: GNAT family N-acetyltransferase [unclassified Halalkaliarchaeum]MDR5674508.1 GNAT family N-acetyltransferase [Halalkaliarchaeum sp. AArc-GB]UWG50382.1 Acetyltransferase (GNAT) family [Halalkaliarchaeum sp. AArc-CO]